MIDQERLGQYLSQLDTMFEELSEYEGGDLTDEQDGDLTNAINAVGAARDRLDIIYNKANGD